MALLLEADGASLRPPGLPIRGRACQATVLFSHTCSDLTRARSARWRCCSRMGTKSMSSFGGGRKGFCASWSCGAAADLTSECMQGLERLDGDNEIELAARCRAAFGPEVCREARHSLGAQPWAHARMRSSCARFAGAAADLNGRSLEEAIAKKRMGSAATPVMDAVVQQKKVDLPAALPPKPVGLVGELLDKVQDSKATPEPARLLVLGKVDQSEAEAQPDPTSTGAVVQQEAHKAAPEAAGTAGGQGEAEGSEVQEQSEPAKVSADEQSSSEVEEEVSNDGQVEEVSDDRQVEEVSDAQTKQVRTVDGSTHVANLTADSAVKLYEEASIAIPSGTSRLPVVLGSLVGAASLAGLTLLLAASAGRHRSSGAHHIELDSEQAVE